MLIVEGYGELEELCQVCHHEPLDKTLCEPNKTLRMTVKAVLKKKLMEKNAQKKKEEEAARAQAEAAHAAELAAQAESSTVNGDGSQVADATGDGDANTEPYVNGVSTPAADNANADPNSTKEANDHPQDQNTVRDLIHLPVMLRC